MSELSVLIDRWAPPIDPLDEAPSYFEYNARRTLPRDKKMGDFWEQLKRSHLAAELEYQVRKHVKRQRGTQ